MSRTHENGNGRRGPVDTAAVGKLFDRLPPHSLEAEMALLGSMILGPEVISDVMTIVRGADRFFAAAHGAIYDALVETFDKHRSGDLVQLLEALRDKGVLEEVGGEEYLVQLAESVPSAASAPHYARIVTQKAKLRDLISAAGTILYDAYHAGELGPDGVREVLDRAEMTVFDIAKEEATSEPQQLKVLLTQEYDRIEAQDGSGVSGIRTGFTELDETLHGLHPGEMIIVAARPSMGKTALALNLAEQIALGGRTPWEPDKGQARTPVAIFSLEMTKSSVTQRLLSAYSGIPGSRFRDGRRLGEADLDKLLTACEALSAAPVYIDDTPGLTVMQLRARARRLAAQHGIGCIMVDYLQLLSAPGAGRESRQVEVAAISRQIKSLAHELELPVICLSQLNRASEQREGNRPRMSDLRESGSIEQDADAVLLLHREEYYHIGKEDWFEANPDKVGVAELIVAKQRNGPTGTVRLTWDNETTRFKNYAPADDFYGYGAPSQAAEVKPPRQYGAATGGAFQPGQRTGPISNHRDGGGPDHDVDEDDTGGAPF